MKIRLSIKLFGAFFLILAIVVGAMFLSRYLFIRDFRTYVHQLELERLKSLVPALQAEYSSQGGWSGITSDAGEWQRLMGLTVDIRRHAPPLPGTADTGSTTAQRALPPRPPPQVLLTDADRRPLIGTPEAGDKDRLVAIEVGGRVVGWLGLHRNPGSRSGPPATLQQRQNRLFYLLGAAVIALTALIAFLFSRHLLKPVQRLTRGTRALAGRDFTIRIPATTRDELGQLAENFNAMARTLDGYEHMRRQWISDISHELRTPLAVLRGEIEAIQDGVRQPTADRLASLHDEIIRITRLVDDLHLLSLADSDSLHLDRQTVFPARILAAQAEKYRPRFEDRGIALRLAVDGSDNIRVMGDANRLEQVFTNILENAAKYVRAPGHIEVMARSDAQAVILTVSDSGPGVPDDALPRLFDRLYRVDASRSRETGGSGLGLSICRQIIDRHDGRIWAAHSAMGGLTIAIRLPRTTAPATA